MGEGWKRAVQAARATQRPRPVTIPKAPNHGECTFLQMWKLLSPPLIVAACGTSLEGKRLAEGFAITPIEVGMEQPAFGPKDRWHFDFAFLLAKVAIEIDGGRGRNNPHQVHNDKYEDDRRRDNRAQEEGWIVLRYTMAMLDSPDDVIGQVVRVVRGRL